MNDKETIKWTEIAPGEFISHQKSLQKDQNLYLKKWETNQDSNKILFLFHDLCQYSGSFNNFIKWARENIPGSTIYSMDFIGHGQSSGTRGHFDEFDFLIQDQFNFLNSVKIEADQQLILVGHGMGGLVTLDMYNRLGNKLNRKPDKLILSNFILNLDHFIFNFKLNAHSRMKKILKHVRLNNIYDPTKITHNSNSILLNQLDPLIIFNPTLNAVTEIKSKVSDVYQDAYYLDIPVMIGTSENDPYLQKMSMNFFIKGVKKELLNEKTYSLMRHDLYNEIDSNTYFNDIKKWIS